MHLATAIKASQIKIITESEKALVFSLKLSSMLTCLWDFTAQYLQICLLEQSFLARAITTLLSLIAYFLLKEDEILTIKDIMLD